MLKASYVLIEEYQKWIEQMHADGRMIFFGTIHFNQLSGSKSLVTTIMQNEAERIYHQLLTNIFRNPRKMRDATLPILIGCPDSPVSKHKPTAMLAEIRPNDGMHYHFILSVPPSTRLRVPLEQHVRQKMDVYRGRRGTVSRFDLRPFEKIEGKRTADYLMKHLKRGTYTTDDILILPDGR